MVTGFGDRHTYIRTGGVYRLVLLAKKLTKVLESIDLSTFRLVAKYLYPMLRKLHEFLLNKYKIFRTSKFSRNAMYWLIPESFSFINPYVLGELWSQVFGDGLTDLLTGGKSRLAALVKISLLLKYLIF